MVECLVLTVILSLQDRRKDVDWILHPGRKPDAAIYRGLVSLYRIIV